MVELASMRGRATVESQRRAVYRLSATVPPCPGTQDKDPHLFGRAALPRRPRVQGRFRANLNFILSYFDLIRLPGLRVEAEANALNPTISD